MTLRHLKIFVTVCEKMNMTKASEVLFISQSAISQAISELEVHYDIKLFERLSRKLYLTEAGKRLLSYAVHMIKLNEELEMRMKDLNKAASIRIGASVTIGAYILPKLVIALKAVKPGADIRVYEENTKKIEKMLLADEIDVGLVEGEVSTSEVLSKAFMKDELILVCGEKHNFAGLKYIKANQLEGEKFIIREHGSGTRKTFESKMEENEISWQAAWTCNNTDTIKMAVKEGLGLAVISKHSCINELLSGELLEVPVKGISFERQFKIIYHKNKYLTETINTFIALCINKN